MECLGREELEELAGGASDPGSGAHLLSCEPCRSALTALREETNLLGELRRALEADAGRAQAAPDDPPGYTRIGLLARGGQGEIVEAVEVATGRRVALKLLVRGHLATAAQRARFQREIELTRGLEHPGLVRVHEAGETPSGRPFLAMELVRGHHLDAWADEQRGETPGDPTRRILEVFLAVCEAVAHAHSRGIVHRDLKPSNILVDEQQRPRVLDLGLAKSLEPVPPRRSGESLRTQTGEILGTLAWMAPERLAGEEDAGPRSDVYCLGLLLHRVVLGRSKLRNATAGADASSTRESKGPALRPDSTYDPRLVAGCREILARALALAPAERHADAGELADDLRGLLAGTRGRPRGRSVAGWAAVLCVACLAGGFAWWILGRRAPSPLAQTGSLVLEAVELARHEGARAYERLLDATERLSSLAPGERGGWDPPRPGDGELSRWRIAASHVWRHYPARLRVAFDPDETWSLLHGPIALDSLWIMRDGQSLSRIDLGSTPSWTDLDLAPGPGRRIGDVRLSPDGRWMCVGYRVNSEAWERELVEVGPGGATRLVRDLGFTTQAGYSAHATWSPTRNWCVVLGAEGAPVQVLDPERPEPLAAFELPSGPPPLAACFLDGDAELLVLDRAARSYRFALPTGRFLGEGPSMPGAVDLRPLGGGWVLRIGLWLGVTHIETGRSHSLVRVSANARTQTLDGPRILVNDNGQMRVLRPTRRSTELEDWAEDETFASGIATRSFGLLSAGRSAAMVDMRGVLSVRDLDATGLPRMLGHARGGMTLHDLEFSRAGAGWLTCRGNEILLESKGAPQAIAVTEPDDLVFCLAEGAPGQLVFGTRAGRVGFVDTDSGQAPHRLHQGSTPVTALDVDPSRRFAAWGDQYGTVRLQALDEDHPRHTALVAPLENRIPRLVFARGMELVAGTLRDGRVFWWRPGSEPISSGHTDLNSAHALAIHPLEDRMVSGHEGNQLAIWNFDALLPSEVHVVSREAEHASIWALAFDASGRFLAIGSGKRVKVWDWELRRILFSAEEHDGFVFALAFHPTLPILASAAELGELFEWDFRAADHLSDGVGARILSPSSLR